MPTQITTVWRASLDGETMQIHRTREALLKAVQKNSPQYTRENADRWVIESSDEEVPVVDGKLVYSTNGYPHLLWICPISGREVFTDFDVNDKGPFLWFCEDSNSVALVRRVL